MKKKAIEKIPFLGLGKLSRKKEAKYIGITAIKNVGHEQHLFLEVYKNGKEAKRIPLVRIVLTRKDFGTYFPSRNEWTKQKIERSQCCDAYNLIWYSIENRTGERGTLVKENILQSQEDLDRIKKICKAYVYKEARWWEYINEQEKLIEREERQKRKEQAYKRRKEALEDRIAHTGELPKDMILDRADRIYFHQEHYLYYKKHGSWAKIACSKCGGVTDARWKPGISYESQFQRHTEKPREGHYGTCPLCGARGVYKCQGKVKSSMSKTIHLFLGQKYKENGVVFRYVEVEKKWMLGFIIEESGPEMYNSCEELSGVEIARAYFEPGKNLQIDYHKHSDYTGDFWDDCNLYGMNNIQIKEARILPETYEELKGTMFQYSALKEYAEKMDKVNPIEYLKRYKQTPQLEILVKMGLEKVAEALVSGNRGIVADGYARRPDEFLGIRKERVKQLVKQNGDIRLLEAMQIEQSMGERWTEEQVEHLAETNLGLEQVGTATRYMTLQKLLNRIERYAGCQYGAKCSGSEARIRHTATTYADYLSMRINLGYDLSNTVYQQPRSLEAVHAAMVAESNKEEADRRLREVAGKYPNIRQCYRKLRAKYFYEDENYIIRPAKSAEEIVLEGRVLHHCVGGDGYLSKHNRGGTYILMLRFKEKPQIPYITVEISGKYPRILQWYGEKDKKPDAENIQKWLDSYLMKLKSGTITGIAETAIA